MLKTPKSKTVQSMRESMDYGHKSSITWQEKRSSSVRNKNKVIFPNNRIEDLINKSIISQTNDSTVEPDKQKVFKKLKQFYKRNYPSLNITKHLSEKPRELQTNSSTNDFSHYKSEEQQLFEAAQKLRSKRGLNSARTTFHNVSSRVNSNLSPLKSCYTTLYSSPVNKLKTTWRNQNQPASPQISSRNSIPKEGNSVSARQTQGEFMSSLTLINNPNSNADKDKDKGISTNETKNDGLNLATSRSSPRKKRPLRALNSFNLSISGMSPDLKPIEEVSQIFTFNFDLERNSVPVAKEVERIGSPFKVNKGVKINLISKFDAFKQRAELLKGSDSKRKNQSPRDKESPGLNSSKLSKQLQQDNNNIFSITSRPDEGKTHKPSLLDIQRMKNLNRMERRKELNAIKNELSQIRQDADKTYAEVKDRKTPEKLEWLAYQTSRNFNKLERRLRSPKPKLYQFEDYLNSVYGENFSIDDFAIAMRPHIVATNQAFKKAKNDPDIKRLMEKIHKEGDPQE